MTQLLSPVMLDNMRNQVDECVANADNEEKLTELRQSSVQQLQEATLNVTMNNDLSQELSRPPASFVVQEKDDSYQSVDKTSEQVDQTLECIDLLLVPPGLKKYWSAYVATVHQVGVAAARKPLPEHPFWFISNDNKSESSAVAAADPPTEPAAAEPPTESATAEPPVAEPPAKPPAEPAAAEPAEPAAADEKVGDVVDIKSNKFEVNMHVQFKTYKGKFEYGIIREAHDDGTFNVDYIDDNGVDCAFGVKISSLKHTTGGEGGGLGGGGGGGPKFDNVILSKQTTDNNRKTIASTHSNDEADDDFDQLKTTDSQNATKPAETIDNNSTPTLKSETKTDNKRKTIASTHTIDNNSTPTLESETKSRKTMITDHPWYSVDSFKHMKSKMRKITKNKIKKGEHMIVHVHSKNIIKVGWAIDGPFGKEKKNKDKQFEMCYYSVMDEPQDYHAWFLPDKDGERGSMLDDMNPNDVDCYWCPAAILKQAKAEDDKVAALYAL